MPKVEIYTIPGCSFCTRAKALLDSKQVKYHEIHVDEEPERRAEMNERTGGNTFPQILVDDRALGGCDDIHALDAAGELDKLLAN